MRLKEYSVVLLGGCLLLAVVSGAEVKSSIWQTLDVEHLDADWVELFEAMHAVERVAAPFVEERSFAFRKTPKLYRGVFRKEADGRVSLAYSEPEKMALHLGKDFAYYRKEGGAVRQIPQSHSQAAALAIFPQLLNFNLSAVASYYEISGWLDEGEWALQFLAKEGQSHELRYLEMRVAGTRTRVQMIELYKSEKQGIVIRMGEPVYPEFYLPEIREKYFFGLDSK